MQENYSGNVAEGIRNMKPYILSLFLLLSPATAFAQDMGAIAGVLAAAAAAVAIPSTDDDNDDDDGE